MRTSRIFKHYKMPEIPKSTIAFLFQTRRFKRREKLIWEPIIKANAEFKEGLKS